MNAAKNTLQINTNKLHQDKQQENATNDPIQNW
jgi:hypothetical protein